MIERFKEFKNTLSGLNILSKSSNNMIINPINKTTINSKSPNGFTNNNLTPFSTRNTQSNCSVNNLNNNYGTHHNTNTISNTNQSPRKITPNTNKLCSSNMISHNVYNSEYIHDTIHKGKILPNSYSPYSRKSNPNNNNSNNKSNLKRTDHIQIKEKQIHRGEDVNTENNKSTSNSNSKSGSNLNSQNLLNKKLMNNFTTFAKISEKIGVNKSGQINSKLNNFAQIQADNQNNKLNTNNSSKSNIKPTLQAFKEEIIPEALLSGENTLDNELINSNTLGSPKQGPDDTSKIQLSNNNNHNQNHLTITNATNIDSKKNLKLTKSNSQQNNLNGENDPKNLFSKKYKDIGRNENGSTSTKNTFTNNTSNNDYIKNNYMSQTKATTNTEVRSNSNKKEDAKKKRGINSQHYIHE